MATIYLTVVSGDGKGTDTSFTPAITTTLPWTALMVHEAKRRALIVAVDDNITDAGVVKLLSDTSFGILKDRANSSSPTPAQRTNIQNWLSSNNYPPLPSYINSWLEIINFVAKLANPAADFNAVSILP